MKSLDTNVIVRVMVRDDDPQAIVAEAAMLEPTMLLATVVLEAVWVLRRGYGWSPDALITGFEALFGIPTLSCPDKQAIRWALARAAHGADFADMLHLALSEKADSFITFDKNVARYADAAVIPVETLA